MIGERSVLALAIVLLVLSACTGDLGFDHTAGDPSLGAGPGLSGDGDGDGALPGGGPGGGPGTGPGGGPGTGDGDGDDPSTGAPAIEQAGPSTRFARLTHSQWRNSVVDLLQLSDASVLSTMLRDDPRQGGFLFDNDGSVLVVDGALQQGYQAAAAQLAEYVTSDPARLELLAPQAGGGTARRDAFIERFGLRAHRRPLTDVDRMAYRQLFDAGPGLYSGLAAFDAGARAVIEALLQSPMFLYRSELSSQPEDAAIPLDGYEVGARLSYFLWNTMPDEALFEAAADGRLSARSGVTEQVARMLADPRASETVKAFHAQLLESDRWSGIRPSPDVYDVSDRLGAYAIEEQERFVSYVFEQGGSLSTLLTSRETFVNDELAAVYGLAGNFDSQFTKVTLPSEQRAGLFTQVGFLAGNATSVDPDPIHRGKFLAERITCKQITAPPTNVPAPPVVSDKTNRERIADYTEMPGSACASCHATLINPFGFPFEGYDAIGAYRTSDRGKPVDAMASPYLDGMRVPVADGVELAERLAESEETHRCYVKHWLEFAHGRPEQASDEGQLVRLTDLSLGQDVALTDLLTELVVSDAFLTRSTEELP